ncbi:MAG: short-chain dehydrogenase [Actinobacteria bacterium RBG_16_68_21]|nr:MAG: short-chain dehydrogenase [Actinobacteria bacterium RBG_16_68_21]
MDVLQRFRLDGKVAVVPGGGGAIGSALAKALSSAGACVTVVDRAAEAVEETVAVICEGGANALSVPGDMTVEADVDRVIAVTLETYGRLDIIVNAIGGGAGKVLFDAQVYPRAEWDWIYELNVRSTLLPTQAAVRAMIAAGRGGRVVNISSVRGQLGINAGYSAYVAAKGAISSLTRQWATEWAKYGITVNAISPTFVDTPQVAMLLGDPAFKEALVARIPIGRVGTPDDLFGAVLLFASDAAAFITGQILTIDGGLTATQ